MAVPEQTPYIEHTGNGATTSFSLGFQCESKDHLIVLVDDIEPPIATWSLTGGNVVFATAPAAGKKITLQRNTPFNRTAEYQSFNNSFRPQTVNVDFDRIWLKLQELGVADWLMKLYVDRLHQQQEQKINDLKGYVDDRDDELRAYLLEEIRKQGVALDQLDEYYNYLMQRLAQIAVDKGWEASFVVDASGKTQQEINDLTGAPYRAKVGGYNIGERVVLENGNIVQSVVAGNTVDPNVDMAGWVSKNLEDYIVFLEFFGASGNDEARDTAAFIEAVNSGATIRLQSGKNYILKTNRHVLGAGKSVRVIAGKDSTITLRRGTHDEVFDATDADKIEFDGVNFLADTAGSTALILRLCYYGAESYVNKVSITNCSSKGNFSINRVSGSQTRDPTANPFGFKEVYVNNNDFSGARGFIFSVTDFPIYYSEFKNNTIRNFSNVAFHILTTNTASNNWKIGRISTTFVHDNIAKNDDSFWNEDTTGNYHCFLLFEGMNCSYQRNHVEGLKSKKSGIELYDAYINTRHLVHCGNTYKNNGIFTTGDATNNWLIKSKTDSVNDPTDPFATVTSKVVTGNTYTIESDWLKRIGYSSVAHKIMDLGVVNGGYAVVKGNTFSLDVLDAKRDIFENLTLAGNTIVCRDTLANHVFGFTAVNSNSHLAMRDNHVTILNPTKAVAFLNGDKPSSYPAIIPWNTLNMQNNSLTLVNTVNTPPSSSMLRIVNAIEANISNMVVNADLLTDYSSCSFNRLNASNVSIVRKSKTSGLRLAYAYTMFGESCSETDYQGLLASDTNFKIHFDKLNPPSTPELFFNISLKLTTRDGAKQLDFSYKLIWDGTNYSVVFRDSSDIEQTFVLGSSVGSSTVLKSELTGGSATVLSVRFVNNANSPSFNLYGLPTIPCKYKTIVNVSE